MSEQRPCRMLGCCRMTAGYQTLRVDDAALREGKTAMAHKRRRFGYRRIHVLLRREGHASVVLPSLVNIAVVNVAAPKISFLHAVTTDRESVGDVQVWCSESEATLRTCSERSLTAFADLASFTNGHCRSKIPNHQPPANTPPPRPAVRFPARAARRHRCWWRSTDEPLRSSY